MKTAVEEIRQSNSAVLSCDRPGLRARVMSASASERCNSERQARHHDGVAGSVAENSVLPPAIWSQGRS